MEWGYEFLHYPQKIEPSKAYYKSIISKKKYPTGSSSSRSATGAFFLSKSREELFLLLG